MTSHYATRHHGPMTDNGDHGGRRLWRPREGRLLGGVCSGIAAYLQVDVNLVRLAFGVFTVFYGLGILIYVAAWAVLQAEGADASALDSFVRRL